MNWFRHYGNGVHAGQWLSLAMVILLALVPGIALSKLAAWLLTPERDKNEGEEDCWRMHGDKRVASTQEIVRVFSPPGPQFLALPRMGMTPSQSAARKVSLNRSRS